MLYIFLYFLLFFISFVNETNIIFKTKTTKIVATKTISFKFRFHFDIIIIIILEEKEKKRYSLPSFCKNVNICNILVLFFFFKK
jgi:hypothetical protein